MIIVEKTTTIIITIILIIKIVLCRESLQPPGTKQPPNDNRKKKIFGLYRIISKLISSFYGTCLKSVIEIADKAIVGPDNCKNAHGKNGFLFEGE